MNRFYMVVKLPNEFLQWSAPVGDVELSGKDRSPLMFVNEEQAYATAETMAARSPTDMWGVMKLEFVLQASKPQIVKKALSNNNQLTPA